MEKTMAASKRQISPDPLLEPPPLPPGQMDYQEHIKTYDRFLRLLKWFVLHMAVLLVALYFFIIDDNMGAGIALLLVSAAMLVYSVFTTANMRRDAESAIVHTGR
jgi:hypothetical protein